MYILLHIVYLIKTFKPFCLVYIEENILNLPKDDSIYEGPTFQFVKNSSQQPSLTQKVPSYVSSQINIIGQWKCHDPIPHIFLNFPQFSLCLNNQLLAIWFGLTLKSYGKSKIFRLTNFLPRHTMINGILTEQLKPIENTGYGRVSQNSVTTKS